MERILQKKTTVEKTSIWGIVKWCRIFSINTMFVPKHGQKAVGILLPCIDLLKFHRDRKHTSFGAPKRWFFVKGKGNGSPKISGKSGWWWNIIPFGQIYRFSYQHIIFPTIKGHLGVPLTVYPYYSIWPDSWQSDTMRRVSYFIPRSPNSFPVGKGRPGFLRGKFTLPPPKPWEFYIP